MKKIIVYAIAALLLIECTGDLLSLLNIEPTGFKLYANGEWNDNTNAYADRDTITGMWHAPNDEWLQSGPCYTTKMKSNQFGARDNNWDTSKKGYLFLGSSFVEGFGIDYGNRVSEVFEKLTHKEVFNCAIAGWFTPVQYYETLRKFKDILKFDTCFVFFILPGDEVLANQKVKDRYRPYLTDTGIYYVKSTALFPEQKSKKEKFWLFIYQYSYVYHLFTYFQSRNILKSRVLQEDEKASQQSYPTISAIMHLFCSNYPDKYFYFVMQPSLNLSPPNLPSTNDANQQVIDLRNSLDMRTDFFQCNEHWNESGHTKVAQLLYDAVFRAGNNKMKH